MPELFHYVPHPRIQERGAVQPTRVADQRRLDHPNPVVRFNAKLGLLITVIVGTMWCAYLFTVIAFISLPSAISSHNLTILIAWISSNFLQLVLLPIIIVGQNIQAKASDKRAEDTFHDAEAVLQEASQIQAHLAAQDTAISDILAKVEQLQQA
jgi:hypothetical protein